MAQNYQDTDKYTELDLHYQMWTEDNDIRRLRKNGWNDITDAYHGKLPNDWPYTSKIVVPLISTTLIEKNARLLNSKLRGRLVPREGGDIVKAMVQNSILDYQWDVANYGGSMLQKWSTMDLDTRLYNSKFALVPWKVIKDSEGKIIFEGNEFIPKDIRDCGIDPNCQNIKDARWFQLREWANVDDLIKNNKIKDGVEVYPGLSKLIDIINNTSDRRDNAYNSRLKQLKGLQDRLGEDDAFQTVELVHEFRPDRWITFAPRHKCIIRDIKNPYKHGKIPIVQLKYYSLADDPLGENEVERVLSLWRAIQATVNAHIDGMNVRMFPPLKIIEGQAKIESIVYGPGAPWIMNSQNAVTEMQFGQTVSEFQTNFSALVSAFNTAMGEISQGVSSIDPFNPQKTATEVKQTARQQNVRDQKNQTELAEALGDCMKMWVSNNQQFLFSDPSKSEYVLRILGKDKFQQFKDLGMDQMELSEEATQEISNIIAMRGGDVSDQDIQAMSEAGKIPKYPVVTNPNVKNPSKWNIKPKMSISEGDNYAELSITPDDMEGNFDYIADVKSMSLGAGAEQAENTQRIFNTITSPVVLQLLQQEQIKPKIKDLLINLLDQNGQTDSSRYFESIGTQALPSNPSDIQNAGMQGIPPAAPQGMPTDMAQPAGLPNTGAIPQTL